MAVTVSTSTATLVSMMTAIVFRLTDCSLRLNCLYLMGTITHIALFTCQRRRADIVVRSQPQTRSRPRPSACRTFLRTRMSARRRLRLCRTGSISSCIELLRRSQTGRGGRFPCYLASSTLVLPIRSALRYCASGPGDVSEAAVGPDYELCLEPPLVSQAHGADCRSVIRRTPPSVPLPPRRPGPRRQTQLRPDEIGRA